MHLAVAEFPSLFGGLQQDGTVKSEHRWRYTDVAIEIKEWKCSEWRTV